MKEILMSFGFIVFVIVSFMVALNPRSYKAKLEQTPIVQAIHNHYQADSLRADSIRQEAAALKWSKENPDNPYAKWYLEYRKKK